MTSPPGPAPQGAALHARRNAAVARGVASVLPIFPVRAQGAELWDADGRRYLDFAGGIGTLNVGHRHPAVADAVRRQLDAYWHPAFQVMAYEPYVALAERLARAVPGSGPKKALFLSTGAEAVENAVKIARAHTGRRDVIAFTGGFHGRTLLTLALTGKVLPYKAAFGPLPGGVWHVPFPMACHGVGEDDALRALAFLFKGDVAPDQVAALLIEPVLGEGGFYAAPPGFLRRLRALCDEHGILFVADEIQCGMGRTGRWFAVEHSGVVPDLVTVAKSLGGGLPLSAVVGRAEVMDAPAPGGLGGTYGGNPLACAAGLAVFDVIEREGLLERSTQLGARFVERFRALAAARPEAGLLEVRGLGSMCALEFGERPGAPSPERAARVREAAFERGLIVLTCGLYGNVIRALYPLSLPDAHFEEGLDLLEAAVLGAAARPAAPGAGRPGTRP